MNKVLVIGNSHTAALKLGHDKYVDEHPAAVESAGLSFEISGVGSPIFEKWTYMDQVVFPVEDRRRGSDEPLRLSEYGDIVIVSSACFMDPRLYYSGKILPLSASLAECIVNYGCASNGYHMRRAPLVDAILSDSARTNRVILVGAPLVSSKVLDLERHNLKGPLRPVRKILDHNSPEDFVVHKYNLKVLTDVINNLNHGVDKGRVLRCMPPHQLLHESLLFTKSNLMKNDLLHGNELYGRLLFEHILKLLSSRDA
jgi:hypothetical protein